VAPVYLLMAGGLALLSAFGLTCWRHPGPWPEEIMSYYEFQWVLSGYLLPRRLACPTARSTPRRWGRLDSGARMGQGGWREDQQYYASAAGI